MTKTVEESLPPRLRARLRELARSWGEYAYANDEASDAHEIYSVCAAELEALLGDWDV